MRKNKQRKKGEKKHRVSKSNIIPTRKEALKELGHVGNKVGEAGEHRVLKACHCSGMPRWWQRIREATDKEDAQGIDHVVFTDVGSIFIQVKTSLLKSANRSPKRNDRDIPIVYVNLKDSDTEIRKRVIRIVAKERKSILEIKESKTGC